MNIFTGKLKIKDDMYINRTLETFKIDLLFYQTVQFMSFLILNPNFFVHVLWIVIRHSKKQKNSCMCDH